MIARPDNGKDGPRGKGQDRKPSMHDHGKSDGSVVPAKLPNKAAQAAEGVVEERGPAKENTVSKKRSGLSAGLSQVKCA